MQSELLALAERPWELNGGDLPDSWVGHCSDCVQPITAEVWWQTALYWIAYRLVLAWPSRWMPWPLLPYAGAYAYACRCSNRAAALRAKAKGGEHD